MADVNKVVLAYSGGLDTSVILAFMVIQLFQSFVIPPLAMSVNMPLDLFGLI